MRTFIINFLISAAIVNHFFDLNPGLSFTALSAFVAFLLVYFMLWLLSYWYDYSHFVKVPRVLDLLFFFIRELIKANLRIAYDVLTIRHHMNPSIVSFPLTASTDLEITLLGIIITLTPGTLMLDVSEDKKILYIHTMYLEEDDQERAIEAIRNSFEKKILAITR